MARGFARKKLLYVLAGVVVVGLLGCIVLVLALGSIAKAGIQEVGPMVTHVPTTVNAVHVSLMHGRFVMEGFQMGNPNGFTSPHCITVGRAEVDAKLSSMFGSVMDIPLIDVKKPQLTLEFSGVHSNFGMLLDGMKQPEAAPKKAGKQMRIGVMRITGATVQVAGLPGGKAVTIPLPKIELTDLSAGGQSKSPAEVAAAVLTALEQAVLKAGQSVLSSEELGALGGAAGQAAKAGEAAAGQAAKAGESAVQKGAAGVSTGAGKVKKGVKSLLGK